MTPNEALPGLKLYHNQSQSESAPSDFVIRNFGSVEPLYIQISQTTISNRQNHNEHYAGMNSGHDVSQ